MDPNLVVRMLLRGLLVRHLQQLQYSPQFPPSLRGVDLQTDVFNGAVQDAIDDTVDQIVEHNGNIHTINEAHIVDQLITNVIRWQQTQAEVDRQIREIPSQHHHTGGRRRPAKKHKKSRKNKN